MADAINFEIAARMPWIYAEPGSIWEITGTYPGGGTFTQCLAMVCPLEMTDGHRVFMLIAPSIADGMPIPPDRISHATRLILVHADQPRTAYFAVDQDLIDRAEEVGRG